MNCCRFPLGTAVFFWFFFAITLLVVVLQAKYFEWGMSNWYVLIG